MKRKIRPGVKYVRLKSKNRPELVDKWPQGGLPNGGQHYCTHV